MRILLAILCLAASACNHIPTPTERRASVDELASSHGWQAITLRTGFFDLVAYLPAKQTSAETLTVFIEGDGLAWIDRSHPSSDPTPVNPLALKLALKHSQDKSAYLARPCQYVDAETTGCPQQYWTDKRFSPEVIAATNHALDRLKQRFNSTRLLLIGYSGGGAVAALAAVRRNDVARLITVAGNLDHRAWTGYHRIHPLVGSLNPTDEISALEKLSQLHFVGGKDRNITLGLVQGFSRLFPVSMRPAIVIEPEYDHECCWVDNWSTLWHKAMSMPAN